MPKPAPKPRPIRRPISVPFAGPVVYGIALGTLVCAVYWYVGYRDLPGLYNAFRQGEAESTRLQEELDEVTAKAETLEAHVADLGADPVELEATVRRNKNVVREGETIYRFELEPDRGARPSVVDSEKPDPDTPNS